MFLYNYISIISIQLKISEQMSKSGFFLSQSHISQDSGFFNQYQENSDRIQDLLTFSCFGSNMISNIIPEMTDKLCSTCNKSIKHRVRDFHLLKYTGAAKLNFISRP